jgi:hypothetical protein
MASETLAPQSGIALHLCERQVELPEKFVIRVLGEGDRKAQAKGLKLIGRRLIVQVSEYMNREDAVRIDSGDAFVLGEVLGSWREGSNIFAAIELRQALTSVSEFAGWGERPRLVEVRQSA